MFLHTKDNEEKVIAEKLGVSYYTVTLVISKYLKNKMKNIGK